MSAQETGFRFQYVCALSLAAAAFSLAATPTSTSFCQANSALHSQRSKELQELYNADQNDYRKTLDEHPDQPFDQKKMLQMGKNDLKRRQRVGEIFGEGCFQTAADYSAAAMIYQHGEVPDHFFQAFIWAKKAGDLGDSKQKHLEAMALDRYLVKSGFKELFGTQADKSSGSSCWCLDQVEETFPESTRQEFIGRSLAESIAWLKSMNGKNDCPKTYCDNDLKPSPRGTVVGFW
jgi:hypothetical protein